MLSFYLMSVGALPFSADAVEMMERLVLTRRRMAALAIFLFNHILMGALN